MAFIERNCVELIKSRISLQDVASPYVNLKRVGAMLRGLSPFKDEKSPSFFIHPEKNFFKCYSSGHAGDVIRFVQLKENLNFTDAVEILGRRFNIPITYEKSNSSDSKKAPSLRRELIDIHEEAAHFFNYVFFASGTAPFSSHAQTARHYWEKERQFPLEIAKDYSIGLAPADEHSLLNHLLKKKFSPQALRESGLFYIRERDYQANLVSRFRGRLMIPIRDVQGQVVAFTGRQLSITPTSDPTRDAKYVNSPETLIFSKGHLLFGLDHARLHVNTTQKFLLVEGQLDAIRCWQLGLHHAITPQGTAITSYQLGLIRRYTTQIDCLLDGDSAGQTAAIRLLSLALKEGLNVNFIILPAEQDPDSLLVQSGAIGLQKLPMLGPMEFAVQSFAPQGMNSSPNDKMVTFKRIFDFFQDTDSYTLAESHLKRAGTLLGLYEFTIDKELASLRIQRPQIPSSSRANISFQKPSAGTSNEKLTSAEYQLLFIVFHFEPLANSIAQIVPPEWINTHDTYGKILDCVLAALREGDWLGINHIDHCFQEEFEKNLIYGLLSEPPPFEDPTKVTNQCIQALFKAYSQKRRQEITQLLAQSASNSDYVKTLQTELIQLREALHQTPFL